MSVFDTTQLTLHRAIAGATLRNAVLADNLANADTPGFQPSDVDFHGALRRALAGAPGELERVDLGAQRRAPVAMRADGNGVNAEAESARLAENGLELSALVQVAGARIQIMRIAMGGA